MNTNLVDQLTLLAPDDLERPDPGWSGRRAQLLDTILREDSSRVTARSAIASSRPVLRWKPTLGAAAAGLVLAVGGVAVVPAMVVPTPAQAQQLEKLANQAAVREYQDLRTGEYLHTVLDQWQQNQGHRPWESWLSADGRILIKTAGIYTWATTQYENEVASLPTEDKALRAWIDQHAVGNSGPMEARYVVVGDLLRTQRLSPAQRAALFRALKTLPGVSVSDAVTTDGRKAVCATLSYLGIGRSSLLFDPTSTLVIEERRGDVTGFNYRATTTVREVVTVLPADAPPKR